MDVTREGLILAVHALFDAQMGEPLAYMERPVSPDVLHWPYYDHLYDSHGPWERTVYSTLVGRGSTQESALQALWDDIQQIWLCAQTPRPRLFWRLSGRIQMLSTPGVDRWWVNWAARTRIAVPEYLRPMNLLPTYKHG